jgi:hypothetical protein
VASLFFTTTLARLWNFGFAFFMACRSSKPS